MEHTTDNSYKSALKATSLFGGVQIFNIAIRIIRSKVVAVLLGPEGMGIVGLLRSTIELISTVTGCGLGQSSVKNIAEANASRDEKRVAVVITIFRKLIWFTGILGSLLCAVFSSYLSQITFGNHDYTIAFVLISVSVLLLQLTAGQNALLQGLQKYKGLAKANVYGSAIGLLITLPLYYFWHLKAIVPVLLSTYLIGFLCAFLFARKIDIPKIETTLQQNKEIGREMLKLGLLLSASGILSQVAAYLVRVFIRKDGSLDDVGLYNAGFAIVNTYIGMVFTAMSTDYFPRLAKAALNPEEYKRIISQQVEMVILITFPLIVAFLVYIKPIVIVLYSSKFLPVESMIYWTIAATIIKSLAWGLSYGLIAKGDMKAFSFCEFSSIVYGLILNIIGYKLWGLMGLGISFFMIYVIYFLHLFFTFRTKNSFTYPTVVWKLSIISSIVIILVILLNHFSPDVFSYSLGSILFVLSVLFSYKEINKRVQLSTFFKNRFGSRK